MIWGNSAEFPFSYPGGAKQPHAQQGGTAIGRTRGPGKPHGKGRVKQK